MTIPETAHTSMYPELDSEILKRFQVTSPSMVQGLCKAMIQEENELYLFINSPKQYVITEVLDIRFEEGKIYLGTPYEKKALQSCTPQANYCIVAFPEGVKIQFEGKGLEIVEYERAQALRINIPNAIVRLQRRNYYRVYADSIFRAQVKLEIDTLDERFEILDFSLAGCALNIFGKKTPHLTGHVFKNVRLHLPDNPNTLLLDLQLKNIKPSADTPDAQFYGCEFTLHNLHDEARLQRFLLTTERRQRAASSS